MGRIKSNATLLDMAKTPKHIKNLKIFLDKQLTNENTTSSSVVAAELEDECEPTTCETIGLVNTFKQPWNSPFFVSMKIMEKIAHCCLIDGGSRPNVMLKTIMQELGLSWTNGASRNMMDFNKQRQATISEIKYVTLVM